MNKDVGEFFEVAVVNPIAEMTDHFLNFLAYSTNAKK